MDKPEETKPKDKEKNEDKPKHKHKKKDRDRKERKDREVHKKEKEEKKIKEVSAKERYWWLLHLRAAFEISGVLGKRQIIFLVAAQKVSLVLAQLPRISKWKNLPILRMIPPLPQSWVAENRVLLMIYLSLAHAQEYVQITTINREKLMFIFIFSHLLRYRQ